MVAILLRTVTIHIKNETLSPWILRQERAFLEDRQKNNIVSLKGKSRSCGQKNKYKRQEKKGGVHKTMAK